MKVSNSHCRSQEKGSSPGVLGKLPRWEHVCVWKGREEIHQIEQVGEQTPGKRNHTGRSAEVWRIFVCSECQAAWDYQTVALWEWGRVRIESRAAARQISWPGVSALSSVTGGPWRGWMLQSALLCHCSEEDGGENPGLEAEQKRAERTGKTNEYTTKSSRWEGRRGLSRKAVIRKKMGQQFQEIIRGKIIISQKFVGYS